MIGLPGCDAILAGNDCRRLLGEKGNTGLELWDDGPAVALFSSFILRMENCKEIFVCITKHIFTYLHTNSHKITIKQSTK